MFKGVVSDVFFDLDHTLWDFDRNSGLTFGKILSDNSVGLDQDDFLKAYVPINLEFWKYYRENRISKEELRYLRLKSTFDSLDYTISDDLIHLLAIQYIEHLPSFNHLLPYAREILEYLKPGYRLHIITNGFHDVQDRKLKNAGIQGYFTHVINSEMAGVKKPDPYIFQLALERSGVPPEKALMIGDNIEADILGARAAGLHTLHFNVNMDPAHELCGIITHLCEIKSYL
jgi:putative hydrolase of the HAD superfamily